MLTAGECLEYARKCARIADLTTDPEIRTQLAQMAREWLATAEEKRLAERDDPVSMQYVP